MMYSLRSTGSLELIDDDVSLIRYPRLVEFENTFRDPEDHIPLKIKVLHAVTNQISACNIKGSLVALFPVIKTLKTYALQDLPNDIIAGLTSGIMMIPQGMAYAALSTLPPIVGLYISFFSSLTYFLFGTGRQLSWGCIAILSLMIATILEKFDSSLTEKSSIICLNKTENVLLETALPYSSTLNDSSDFSFSNSSSASTMSDTDFNEDVSDAVTALRLEVASAVSIVAGIIFIVASRLGLSRITSIMSDSLITGFTVGISFHVATSQLKTIFGLSVPRYSGIGAIVRTWISLLQKLPQTNVATLITFVISLLVIYLVKKFINDRYKKHMRTPIPVELIVVIVATLISKFANLHDSFNVKVVETVPVGVPAPKFPDLSLAVDYIGDGVIIIVIGYTQTLAMAKTLGLKNNYTVDSNQEMLACGVCSVVCGFFSGYICGASVSRSVVQDGAGGKTQVASLFAAGLVLLVIMLIGPYVYYLPMCVLSAIIVVNLQTIFLKILDIPNEWKRSSYDCAVWVFACISCVFLNADGGLLAGVLFSLFLIVLRAMQSPVAEVGQIQVSPFTMELRSLGKYSLAKQLQNVKIIQIKTPLYFVNAEVFTTKVFHKTGIDPIKIRKLMKSQKGCNQNKEGNEMHGLDDSVNCEKMYFFSENLMNFVILDVSGVAFIDAMGIEALHFLINEFRSVGVEVLITCVPERIIPMLKSTGFWVKHGDRLFLTVETALASIVTTCVNNDASSTELQTNELQKTSL